ncbi:hypothetical protein [Rathayibacter sp. VKM Ac-2760]|uniref:DUF6993 domain-containing protein n=1 Tax=Rathayibacter sp. VKM Ac-2760 TaxID=2609253 RepID=UPI00131872BC|nr:hypothetical protein [Rathayibacter sp. VKM Ac-2760]QHC59033.1 hypothetical protein GSU72_11055 [Rathayibacter sp. VKM Ac-2760]
MSIRTVVRAGLRAGAVLALLAGMTGCTAPAAPPAAQSPSASAAPSGAESAAPVALVPGGTAEENLPFFRQIVTDAAGSDPATPGRSVVDALVAAGFAKESMQLTADETSVGLAADSVQVSVKASDACLIGQYGPKVDGVRAEVAAPIATGACLIGSTVPLDG